MTTPLSVYLPFNIDCLRGAFVPAKRGTKPPSERGNWLIIQDQKLIVVPDGDTFQLPTGTRPAKLDGALGEPIWLGTLGGDTECWVASLPKDAVVPDEFRRETLVPMAGTRLPDDLLSLGGMAMQALWWESTSGFCPRCGDASFVKLREARATISVPLHRFGAFSAQRLRVSLGCARHYYYRGLARLRAWAAVGATCPETRTAGTSAPVATEHLKPPQQIKGRRTQTFPVPERRVKRAAHRPREPRGV